MPAKLDHVLIAISDPTRRAILGRLALQLAPEPLREVARWIFPY